jgi:hypothetical protein
MAHDRILLGVSKKYYSKSNKPRLEEILSNKHTSTYPPCTQVTRAQSLTKFPEYSQDFPVPLPRRKVPK